MTFGFCARVLAIEKKRLGVGWVQSAHSHNHSGSHTEWAVGPLANQCAGFLKTPFKLEMLVGKPTNDLSDGMAY